ncbi:hypothetical protein YDYSY3_40420 [Paenibacillus chitinolyticus]|nr:hypothetical protein YDYSY3_40420 [Paenibacillus chitinolyticus]
MDGQKKDAYNSADDKFIQDVCLLYALKSKLGDDVRQMRLPWNKKDTNWIQLAISSEKPRSSPSRSVRKCG